MRESVGSLPQKVIAIPRLAKHYASGRLAEPSIQFGSKLVEPTAAREALVAPVRSAKLNVKRWLRLSILSTLVFGLLTISWHALNCHLWIQLLHMDRASFLVLPPAIGTVILLYSGLQMWRWVAELPEAILLKAIAEGLGVDDEGIESLRTAAAQFNRTVESLEQAKESYEKLREQIAQAQEEYHRVVPQSGGLKQAAIDAGERMGRKLAGSLAPKLDRVLSEAALRFGIDPAALGAPLAAECDEESAYGARVASRWWLAAECDEESAYDSPPPLRRESRSVSGGSLSPPTAAERDLARVVEAEAEDERGSPRVAPSLRGTVPPSPSIDERLRSGAAAATHTAAGCAAAAGPDEPALPQGWSSAVSPDGRTYFYHVATRTTQWKPPAATPAEAAALLPPGWRRVQDAKGRWYYFHRETRSTQWEPP